ncbi:protein of unknown function [Candidatus Methylomirabilis oxygeniifera]|uniref:Uncharacterized protein n=1 Tax=Methylomirabilis oxygeniifera TaxID=671143 RepID=D5MJN8_METO1|nr:protein of unknown function [Candidatus Methylomirabilis oxyfera]
MGPFYVIEITRLSSISGSLSQRDQCRGEYGGQGRNRTVDTRIFSPVLYRLSYLPKTRMWMSRLWNGPIFVAPRSSFVKEYSCSPHCTVETASEAQVRRLRRRA